MFGKMLLDGLDGGVDMKPVLRTASNAQFQLSTFPFFLCLPVRPATGRPVWKLILGVTKLLVLGKFRSHRIPPVGTPSCLPFSKLVSYSFL